MMRRKSIQERATLRAAAFALIDRGFGRLLNFEGVCKLAAERGATAIEHDNFGGAYIETPAGREWISPQDIATAAVEVI